LSPVQGRSESKTLELLHKVRRLELSTRKQVDHIFSGAYHSIFKGMGIEFADIRPYIHGDDIRSIDWTITARTGNTYVRRYQEERELHVLIAVDVSASMGCGSADRSKFDLAAELATVIAFSAMRNHDRV
jgi:uncharacterized protein (DUF58 family)